MQSISLSPAALQVLLVVAGLGCCVAMSMPQVHIIAYCMDLGYGVVHGADMLSIMMAAGVVSRLASGFVADRIGGVKTLLIGSVLQCLSLLFYIPFDGLASLYVVSLVFGLSQGGIVPCYAIIVREYMPAKEAGQRIGIVMMATIFGMAIGGWMSGWIYDLTGSYAAAFLNGIAWNLVNVTAILSADVEGAAPGHGGGLRLTAARWTFPARLLDNGQLLRDAKPASGCGIGPVRMTTVANTLTSFDAFASATAGPQEARS